MMARETPILQHKISWAASRWKPVAAILLAILAAMVVAVFLLATVFPPTVKIEPQSGSHEVPVGSQLKISASWLRGNISDVTVKEISLDPMGNPVTERMVEGTLRDGVFVPADGSPLLKPDARYEVRIEAELTHLTSTGPERRSVTENIIFQTTITPAPVFLKDTQTVAMGEPIVVEFNTPVTAFEHQFVPELRSSIRIDPDNATRAFISFEEYEQGTKYQLTITGTVAENGITQERPYSQTIATTDPLTVIFVPGDGEGAVSLERRPTLTFSEEIRNQDQFELLISIGPEAAGSWEWVNDRTVEFRPQSNWARDAKITMSLKGGPGSLRGQSGSFIRYDVESTFTTKSSKLIDVNLTTQKVVLFENDKPVKEILASTGKQATPSLTGTYTVYHKAPKVDMRGEGYFVPDVPWVLMFNGDYTIHGNYWATQFGVPSSNGCVGLPVPEAEFVYNWTTIGTVVQIHN